MKEFGVWVKVIASSYTTYKVWVYFPWSWWDGDFTVTGNSYTTFTADGTFSTSEPTVGSGEAAQSVDYYDWVTSQTISYNNETLTLY
jgi:hypothetical protein